MRKRILSVLSVLCMAMIWSPITAKAEPVQEIKIAGQTLNASTPYYHNEENGGVGTSDNVADGANATFDATTGTLTLNNLNVSTDVSGIWWEYNFSDAYDLIIVLPEGTVNTIVRTTEGSGINGESGFSSGPSLTIQGAGTLNVTGGTNGIWVWQDVTIQDSAKVKVTGQTKAGIVNNSTDGKITISGNAEVNVKGATYGIGYDNDRTNSAVIQGGTLIVEGGTGAFQTPPSLNNDIIWTANVGDLFTVGAWDTVTGLETYQYVKLVASGTKTTLSGNAVITGTPKYGETLYAELSHTNNTGTLTYTWKSGNEVLYQSTSNYYALLSSDIGKAITVTITSSNHTGSVISEVTAAVEKRDGFNISTEPQGVKPSVAGGADGKITGIDASVNSVECSTSTDFSNAIICHSGTEITGLTAGTYYVRHVGTDLTKPGPYVTVIVPEGDPVISSHTHSWSNTWTRNESHHWHQCEGTGICDIIDESQKGGYGTHAYDNDTDTTCNTCGFTRHVPNIPEQDEDVESGVVENVTDKTTNECAAVLDVSGSDLVAKVLTADDQQKVTGGKDVKIWLAVADGDTKATSEDKTLTQDKLGDYTLGACLDIILWKQFEGENAVAVSNTNKTVTIKLTVPQNLINTDTSKTRAYEIIRVHNDGTGAKAEILPCSFDAATNTISFDTDKFSIYSIAYKDMVVTPPGDNEENNNGGNTDNGNVDNGNVDNSNTGNNTDDTDEDEDEASTTTSEIKQKDNVPKTGENSNMAALFLLALISGVSAISARIIPRMKM